MLDYCTLGTGGSLPMPDRGLAALYLRVNGRGLLVDCGEGTQTAIRRLGWGFKYIDALLITHFHGDHCGGLPGFLLSLDKAERREPFHIYGNPGLRQVVDGLRVIAPHLRYPVVLHEWEKEIETFSLLGMEITAFPLQHGIPCRGFLFHLPRARSFSPEKAAALHVPVRSWKNLQQGQPVLAEGKEIRPEMVMGAPRQGVRLLYATDTRPTPAIVTYGRHADLMILEGMYGDSTKMPQALANRHMLFQEAAALAREAGARQLLLTHFSTSLEEPEVFLPLARDIFPHTDLAQDIGVGFLQFPKDPADQDT